MFRRNLDLTTKTLSDTSRTTYKTTWRHNSDSSSINFHRGENTKSHDRVKRPKIIQKHKISETRTQPVFCVNILTPRQAVGEFQNHREPVAVRCLQHSEYVF
jgi:hypothetical protein